MFNSVYKGLFNNDSIRNFECQHWIYIKDYYNLFYFYDLLQLSNKWTRIFITFISIHITLVIIPYLTFTSLVLYIRSSSILSTIFEILIKNIFQIYFNDEIYRCKLNERQRVQSHNFWINRSSSLLLEA